MPATIVYLHGLNSAPTSVKASALGAAIAALPVASRPEYAVPNYIIDPPWRCATSSPGSTNASLPRLALSAARSAGSTRPGWRSATMPVQF